MPSMGPAAKRSAGVPPGRPRLSPFRSQLPNVNSIKELCLEVIGYPRSEEPRAPEPLLLAFSGVACLATIFVRLQKAWFACDSYAHAARMPSMGPAAISMGGGVPPAPLALGFSVPGY